ncbi:MAG TPA: hypothetical protein VE623_11020 [Acidimicrobiales bacterium]|nr:hypothetical protein [Acidimicrobiales bacterium]
MRFGHLPLSLGTIGEAGMSTWWLDYDGQWQEGEPPAGWVQRKDGGYYPPWWMDDDGQWHEGEPPAGWVQGEDGHYYPPPPPPPASDDATRLDEPAWDAAEPTQPYDPEPYDPEPTRAYTPSHATPAGRRGIVGTYLSWPRWARIAAPLSAAIIGLGAIGVMAGDPDESDGEQVAAEDDSTTTTERPTTTERATTTTAPPTPPPTTRPPATTAAPTTSPPATQPRSGGSVTPGAFCSPAGATGTSADGVPMTCSTEKCHGTPHEQPRWRRTSC